jgi:8-oxo-dGTP pyrophosphatase MutT (NUDIX family)
MKTEHSAGGIVIRKQKPGCFVLIIKDMNHSWTFPKGMIELGEKPVEAAVREIAEETGVNNLKLIKPLEQIE